MIVDQLIAACGFDTAKFLIFSNNVFGTLIYYSHLFSLIPALIIGIFILIKNHKSILNRILFFITVLFSIWAFFDLIIWATEKPEFTMFFWSVQILVEVLIYATSLYFIKVFIDKNDITFKNKMQIGLLLLPIVIFLPTKLVLTGIDLTNCNRDAIEGFISTYYIYFVEIIYILWILIFSVRRYLKATAENRRQIILITIGIVMFLIALSSGNIIGSFTDNWDIAQIGLFGMPIFIIFLSYLIVRFKTFNIKLLGAQVLVLGLGFLVLAIAFVRDIQNVRLVVGLTLVLVLVLGTILIKSVRKEVKQREELERLNIDLQKLIQQRESLVHLITHKVKGSFTHTKYIFSEILEGSFGLISPELKKMAELGLESDQTGVDTVDLILNASNLQKGTVKYEMKPVDIKDMIIKTVEEKKDWAEKKGLKVETEITNEDCMISGDSFWLKEVVNNLIENAIRYTKEGTVKIGLKKENGKILYFVKDTGVGITDEDKKNLFTEGGRGKNSVSVNVDSTGYGLFTVKLIVEAHGGKVWAESEGQGKGSEFSIELNSL